MSERDHLEEYFQLCKRIYEQMERDGTWPWTTDLTNSEDVIDSKSKFKEQIQ